MLRVPARNYSKVSNTRSGLPGLRVKSPNTSTYLTADPTYYMKYVMSILYSKSGNFSQKSGTDTMCKQV